MTEAAKFEQWAIVEVMGHQRYVGMVTEEIIAGTGFVRVDVPGNDEVAPWTKIVGTASIYAITPVSEEIARGLAARSAARPVQAYELPALAGPKNRLDDDDDDDRPSGIGDNDDQLW